MASASELLDAWVRTFNESAWEAGLALGTPDAVTEEIGTGRSYGPEEGVEISKAWKAAYPDARGEIVNRVVAGNQAVAEIVWRGTQQGELQGLPATGRVVTVQAVVVLQERDGKIARVRHYIDMAGMLAQLGVQPGQAQQQAATA